MIGSGGMGTVWRARHVSLGTSVALKLLRVSDRRRAKRFLQEARAAASVSHDHVVDILDFGLLREDEPYMVMELLEGRSLAERLRLEPPLLLGELLDILDLTLEGLGAIHAAGVVHRDLKPENIFLVEGPDGPIPKVVDFGLSAPAPGADTPLASGVLTLEGEILGTPSYMSPEQVRRLDDIDGRADIYGVGVLLYATITGRLPYDAPNVIDVLLKIAGDTEADPLDSLRPEVGSAMSDLVHRAMAKARRARFPTAAALAEALREVRAAHPEIDALETRPLTHSRPPARGVTDPRAPVDGLVLTAPEITVIRNRRAGAPRRAPLLRRGWMLGLFAAVLVAGGGLLARMGPGPDLRPSAHPPQAPLDRQNDALSIVITWGALPAGARVEIDGRAVSGPEVRMPRDLREHSVDVRAPGYEPWSTAFVADSHQQILPRLELTPPEPPPARTRPARSPAPPPPRAPAQQRTPENFEEQDD